LSSPDWSPLDLVRWTTDYFRRHGIQTPRLDAEILLAHVLGSSRIDLYLSFDRGVEPALRDRYRELVRRRALERVPVPYLTGGREFWSRRFHVGPGALVPRPETETVVQAVIDLRPRRLVDVGTGCGAIACAVALELPDAEVIAVDRSRDAVRLARQNVLALGLEGRIRPLAGDLLTPLETRVDVIAANLPYVPSGELESLPPEVRHEPRMALDGGKDGLDLVRRLIPQAHGLLERPGVIILEVGENQAGRVEELLRDAGASGCEVRKDLAQVERVVIGRFEEG
jgi:release factor glutamine methyltransferase